MAPVALDGTKLLIFMASGGVFAIAGLWLMFRPRVEGHAARVELFGLKFQSSSTGLLVFLIGAVFLAVPIVVPERPSAGGTLRDEDGPAETRLRESTAGQTAAVILPPGADAAEKESNDFVTEANQIARGSFYAGATDPERRDVEDWFVVPTGGMTDLDFQLRNRAYEGQCYLTLLNASEERLHGYSFPKEGTSLNENVFVGGSDHAFLRVHSYNDGYACEYEIKVR